FHTHLAEGRYWLTRALAADADAPPAVRARALHGAGQMAHWQGDDAQATPLFEAALALWREVGDRRGAALALMLLGIVNEDQGKYAAARPFLEEAAALYQAEGETAWATLAGAYHLGTVAFGEGDYPQAQILLEEALRRFQAVGNRWGVGISLYSLGLLAYQRGDPQGAARRYGECLAIVPESRSTESAITCLAGVAALATAAHPERAARLFGVAAALAEPLGVTFTLAERLVFEQAKQTTRSALGDSRFAAAYHAMRNVTLEQVIAEGDAVLTLLCADCQGASQHAVNPADGPALTARELDVLRLIVAGRRDQEIADALFLSRRTVQTHVTHLFAKLRVNTRAEAAACAVRRGLV
ncbi:MAG TPA: tetratricopeptide repeat protein, partial [Nitrolancea sp.]|nr:tetratricopeptide repeat protein [Nitrolancea sp.]